jgi:hypothetical protein
VTLWRIVRGPLAYSPSTRAGGEESGWGRAWEVEHTGSGVQKRVYVELTAAAEKLHETDGLADEAERAVASEGRGAVGAHLDDREPPDLLTISESTVSQILYERQRPYPTAA